MGMISNLLRRVGLMPPVPEPTYTSTGIPVSHTDERKLYGQVAEQNRCPDCGGEGFYAGPEGGMSINVHCANRACRSAFNVTPLLQIAERIGKRDLTWYPPPDKDETPEALKPGHRKEPHDGY